MKAVIPAAGLGTRLLPATKSMPKEMLPIVDKPVIQYVVEEAVASGIEDILIVTGRGKRAIEDHFDRSFELEEHLRRKGEGGSIETLRAISEMARIHYVRQPEALGLGDAILRAQRFVGNAPFAVLLGDDIVLDKTPPLVELVEASRSTGGSALSVMEVREKDLPRYGIIERGPSPQQAGWHRVRRIVEKPEPGTAPSNLAALGRYVLQPEVFRHLASAAPGVNGEIQLTDALDALCRGQPLTAVTFRGTRLDVGSVEGFLEANLMLAQARPHLREALSAAMARGAGRAAAPMATNPNRGAP